MDGFEEEEEKCCWLLLVRELLLLTHAERLIMHPELLLLLLPMVEAEVVKGERVVALMRHLRSGPCDMARASLQESAVRAVGGGPEGQN